MNVITGKDPVCIDCGHASHAGWCHIRTDMWYRTRTGHLIEVSRICLCSPARHSSVRNRRAVLAVLALILVCVGIVVFGGRASAAASPAEAAGGSPLHGAACSKGAPLPQLPKSGLPGIFLDDTELLTTAPIDDLGKEVPSPADPDELFGTSGMAGMTPFTYDQGCDLNPLTASTRVDAWTDREFASYAVGIGQAWTTLGDAIDHRAWDPEWISAFLGKISRAAVGTIEGRIVIPFLGIGMLVTSLLLVRRMMEGDTARVASATAWTIVVLLISGVVLFHPTFAAKTVQKGASNGLGVLYADGGNGDGIEESPAQQATNAIVKTVHYDGYLRRTFGTNEGETPAFYGPYLLAATRFTWADEMKSDPNWEGWSTDAERAAAIQYRKDLIESRQKQFDAVAASIAADDPQAYEWVKGGQGATLPALYEMGFAFCASVLRIAADLLLILACVLLTIIVIIWLIASPFLVTPTGQPFGQTLLDTTARAVVYAGEAALASWLWSIYCGIVLAPGNSSWWAFVLLAVGAFVFWTVLRPDRKALALLSTGKVRGNGNWTRWAVGKVLMGATAGWVATKRQGRLSIDELRQSDERREADERRRYGGLSHAESVARLDAQFVDPERTIPVGSGRAEAYQRAAASTPPGQRVAVTEYDPLLPPSDDWRPWSQSQRVAEPPDPSGSGRAVPVTSYEPLNADGTPYRSPTPPPAGAVGDSGTYQRPASTVVPVDAGTEEKWWRQS